MDKYIGLTIRLSFNDSRKMEGIVKQMDLSTQSLALSHVTCWKDGDFDTSYFDTILVKGSDIVDLEIVPSISPVNENAVEPVPAPLQEQTLRSQPQYEKREQPPTKPTPAFQMPVAATMAGVAPPPKQQYSIASDIGGYFKPTSVLPTNKLKQATLSSHKHEISANLDAHSVKPTLSFNIQTLPDSKPQVPKSNVSTGTVNYPPGFSFTPPPAATPRNAVSLEEIERGLRDASLASSKLGPVFPPSRTAHPMPAKNTVHAPLSLTDTFKDLDLDTLAAPGQSISSLHDKITNSPHLVSKNRLSVGAASKLNPGASSQYSHFGELLVPRSEYNYKNEPSTAFVATSSWKGVDVHQIASGSEFDFDASNRQFDKKRIFDEIKSTKDSATPRAAQFVNTENDVHTRDILTQPISLAKKKIDVKATTNNPSLINLEDLVDFYDREDRVVPIITPLKLAQILKYATVKWGPNTVQIIENGSRSILELLQREFASIFSVRRSESPSNGAVLIVTCEHRLGAISLALSRLLANRGMSVIVWLASSHSLADSASAGDENAEKKYVDFQLDIAGRHHVKVVSNMRELEEEPAYLKKSFSAIIDATAVLDTDTNISTRKNTPSSLRNSPFPDNLIKTINQLNCIKILLHSPSSAVFKVALDKKPFDIVSLILPTADLMKEIQVYHGTSKERDRALLPRIFCVDIGISPYLLKKYDILRDSPPIATEISISKNRDFFREYLVNLFATSSYHEVYYAKK